MKKKILYFILFFIIVFITIMGCITNTNSDSKNTESKEKAEIGYIESKLSTLLNSMNNITFENYNISVKQINEQTESNSKTSGSESSHQQSGQQSGGQGNDSSNGQGQGNGGSQSSQGNSSSESNQGNNSNEGEASESKQYKLERTGILTGEDKVDWDNIKNETELMYSIIPTVTLDLYQKNVSQDDILSFNKEVDKLTEVVKKEDKENTLKVLANLYSYLPKYSRVISDEKESLLLETKSNIFYAYSLLEVEDWNRIKEYVQKAIECYARILNNIDDSTNNNSINKGYVLLNELNNAVTIKNKDIFLIKYKNLLEELNIL